MPIGLVQSVDTEKAKVTIEVQGASGTRIIPSVRLLKGAAVPAIGDRILALKDGSTHYHIGSPELIGDIPDEERRNLGTVPGDTCLGDPNGPGVHVRKGGMVSVLADKLTGFVTNSILGIVQLMGKIIAFDTAFWHKKVTTTQDNLNSTVDEALFGSPYGNPSPTRMISSKVSTLGGVMTVDLASFSSITGTLTIDPTSGMSSGTNVNLSAQTPMGPLTMSFDGATGNVLVTSPGMVKIQVAQAVMINSEGNPLDRVVTCGDTCWYTGAIHGTGSNKLFVGKV